MSPHRRKGQERKPSEVRQSEIVDAAIRIMALDGARCFTAERIAAEVGITSGTIFRHFESMGAIVDRAVERMGAILASDFANEATDPMERLRLFFLNRTRTIVAHPHISRLLLSDHLAQAGGSEAAERLTESKKQSRAFVFGCLREAEQAGTLVDGVNAEVGTVIVLGAILALAHGSTRVVSETKIERLSKGVWSTIERMLGTRILPEEPTKHSKRRQPRQRKEKE